MPYDRAQDIQNVMAGNSGMSAADAAAQVDRNAAFNTRMTEAFGMQEGGANKLALQKLESDISKQLEGTGLVKDLQKSAVTIKGQVGAAGGEEKSILLSPDAEASSRKVGKFTDWYDETSAELPKQLPKPKNIESAVLGSASALAQATAPLMRSLEAVGKNLATPGGAGNFASIAKAASGSLPGDLKGLFKPDIFSASIDQQVKNAQASAAKFAGFDKSLFDPDKVQADLKKASASFGGINLKLPKFELPTDKISTAVSGLTGSAAKVVDVPGFQNPLSSIANATLPGVSKFLPPGAESAITNAAGAGLQAAAAAAPGLLNLAGQFGSSAFSALGGLTGGAPKTLNIPGLDPTKALGSLPTAGGSPAAIGGFLKGLNIKQTATPSADSLGDTLPKAVKSEDNRAQFFPADKLEAQAASLKAGLEKQFSALGLPQVQEVKVTQKDIDEARRISAADIAAGKPESEWSITPQQVANNRGINAKATAAITPKIDAVVNSGPMNDFKAQADAFKARMEARFGPSTAKATGSASDFTGG